jgi:orotate phosphoribosyltransferase-like protein
MFVQGIVKEIDRLEKIGLTQDEIANDLSIKFNVNKELILNII